MIRYCLNCGRELIGRTDKKFCSNKCRNAYHNAEKNSTNSVKTRVVSAINKNYGILYNMLKSGITSAEILELEQIGFRPCFITSERQGRRTHKEYACYDIIYCQTGSRIFDIRKSELLALHLNGSLGGDV